MAIVHLFEYPTSSGVDVDGLPIRFQARNTTSSLLSNPIPEVTSGYVYSYEKWFRLNVISGIYTSISNTKFFWEGPFPPSITAKLGYRIVSGSPPTWVRPVRPPNGIFPPPGFSDATSFVTAGLALAVHTGVWNTASAVGAGANQSYLILTVGVSNPSDIVLATPVKMTWYWDES